MMLSQLQKQVGWTLVVHERDASPESCTNSRDRVSKLHINITISLAAVARTITQCTPPRIACHLTTAT
jgi:hypothetical protein